RTRSGFALQNFWCDLLASRGHDGQDNALGSWLARLALVTLAAIFPPYVRVLAEGLSQRRAARASLFLLAGLGSLGLALVALATGIVDRVVHDWAILLLGPCGVLALVWGIALGIRRGSVGV